MHVINQRTCNSKILSLHDVFKICQKTGIFRLVKNDEDDKYIRIIICGIYRIQKNKKSGKISMWCCKLKDEVRGVWYRVNSLPSNVHLFWSKRAAFDMDDWLRHAIKYIIKSLIEAGFSIEDKIYLYRVRASNGKSDFISTLIPSSMDEQSYHNDLFTSLGKTASFNYPNKIQHISKNSLLEEIENKIHHRAYKVIGLDNEFNASKSLSKNIWLMVDKSIFTHYARASHCSITYNSIRQSMFEDYLDFSKRIHINDGADFGGLWPMVGRLRRQYKKGEFVLSGKTKELFEKIKFPCDISYGDFKNLRRVPISLVSALDKIRYESFGFFSRLLRHPLIKHYPVKVIYWIIDYLECRYQYERDEEIYRVCSKWLEYNRDLFKNIGFRECHIQPWERSRWEMEKNQLCHVIDWVLDDYEAPIIHKNQEWPSFWRLSENWTQQLRRHAKSEITAWKGTGINWESIDNDVREIITFDDLCSEGQEMEHCVASYAPLCASGKYIAISVYMEKERATLGLSRKEHNSIYQFDQMRGFHNQAVSKNMIQKGNDILKSINSSIK